MGFFFFQENVDAEAFAAHVEKSVFTASTDKIKHIFNHGIKGFSAHLSEKSVALVRFCISKKLTFLRRKVF